MSYCLCGSEKSFAECCQRLLENEAEAKSALELMRSRYSAYCLKDARYLNATSTSNVPEVIFVDEEEMQWLQLKINAYSEAEVTFSAYYRVNSEIEVMKEHSFFIEEEGRLKYDRGEMLEVKIERNETCPCGSGKKYKKCCGK